MTRPRVWWNQADQFDWITSYLRQSGLLRLARTIMAVVSASAAMVPVSELSNLHLPAVQALIVDGATAAYTVGMVIIWLVRWPTRRQSLLALSLGVLCIASWAFAQPSPAYGALACMALAVTGGYSAAFHGPRVLVAHSMLAVPIATAAALRLPHQSDIPAASAFWLLNFVILSVSLGFWGMSRGIRAYAHRSDQDDLTGLLNRRALTDALANRLANPPPAHTHLVMAMIDLDNFKALNDTHGHPVGDDVLRTVAQLLHEHTPAEAIICRAGGEEFLIALTTMSFDRRTLAAQICAAIAGLSPQITASVGTASAELRLLTGPDRASLVEELISIADQAMYAAKRSGGNQAHHA